MIVDFLPATNVSKNGFPVGITIPVLIGIQSIKTLPIAPIAIGGRGTTSKSSILNQDYWWYPILCRYLKLDFRYSRIKCDFTMKNRLLLILAFALLTSHDMYLKLDSYFLEPNTWATIDLFNGTFEKSENVIARSRMTDVSLVGNGARTAVDSTMWTEKDSITTLKFKTGEAGTWVAGVSTRPRNIELSAADFNSYLEHDGVLDMLAWRKETGAMEQDAVEKYSKHVKTLFQVGEQTSEDWKTVLGYPIEFVPLENPYDLHPGHELPVQLLWQGKPLANQLVYVGSVSAPHEHEAGHGHSETADHQHDSGEPHQHSDAGQYRTDAEGRVRVKLTSEGTWYLRTIHMEQSEAPGLTHESNWATLTFAIGQGHSHEHADEVHDHEDETGIPSYVYWLGSLLLLAVLFFWFKRKN